MQESAGRAVASTVSTRGEGSSGPDVRVARDGVSKAGLGLPGVGQIGKILAGEEAKGGAETPAAADRGVSGSGACQKTVSKRGARDQSSSSF